MKAFSLLEVNHIILSKSLQRVGRDERVADIQHKHAGLRRTVLLRADHFYQGVSFGYSFVEYG